MQTIDFIVSYLRDNATEQELAKVAGIVNNRRYQAPPIDPVVILEKLVDKVNQMRHSFPQVHGKLECIKYIKDVTNWGLKECKDWFDNVIEK